LLLLDYEKRIKGNMDLAIRISAAGSQVNARSKRTSFYMADMGLLFASLWILVRLSVQPGLERANHTVAARAEPAF
jgi:hypothetical protein